MKVALLSPYWDFFESTVPGDLRTASRDLATDVAARLSGVRPLEWGRLKGSDPVRGGGRAVKVLVNGRERELPDAATVRAAVEALELPAAGRGVAVAVDAEVVPRTEWETHELQDGARVEVLRAIQGG